MFDQTRFLFMYVETPLHAGTGRGLGAVDLPIQRERTTGYPMVQGSGVKGVLRAETKSKVADDVHRAVFGPDTDGASEHAGALSVGDARLLLFPIRSLAGVFAWATSRDLLSRFRRDVAMTGLSIDDWDIPNDQAEAEKDPFALVDGNTLIAGQGGLSRIVLEEFSFQPKQSEVVGRIAKWLGEHALPAVEEYQPWREALKKKLCILPDDIMRDFVLYATEVQTHIKINNKTKTVDSETGALWTTESLPVDSLLYSPLMASPSRYHEVDLDAGGILSAVQSAELSRIQLGGNETTGQGVVALRYAANGGVA
jgi:CRISPR-associated protein Cmr4